jgi:hypothetical protein
MPKRQSKRQNNTDVSQVEPPEATPREAELLGLLQSGVTSTMQLASRMKIGASQVRNLRSQLRQKGLLGISPPDLALEYHTPPGPPKSKRKNVHAQRLRLKVHWASESYKKNCNQHFDNFYGVQVQCFNSAIIVRADGQKFYGDTEEKAFWNSISFWKKIIHRLEHRLRVELLKTGHSFEFIYWEWETENSVVCRDAQQRGHMWKVYHSEDGKLRLTTDMSTGYCHEMHHTKDGFVDDGTWSKFVNGVLNHPDAPGVPEIAKLLYSTIEVQRQQTHTLNIFLKMMSGGNPHEADKQDQRQNRSTDNRPSYVG